MSLTRSILRRLRSRARAGIFIEGLAWMVVAFAAFMVASYVVDRSLRLEVGFRLVLLIGLVIWLGRVNYLRLLRPLATGLDDEEMALAVERADPHSRQALISAIQFEETLASGSSVDSPELMSAVVGDVQARVAGMETEAAIDGARILRFGATLAFVVLAVTAWAMLEPANIKLWAMRNLALSTVEWPRATSLQFAGEGEVVRLPEGDDLTLRVRATGVVPDQVALHYELSSGEKGTEPMTMTGAQEFTFTFEAMLEGVTVCAEGGDRITPELKVEIVERPRIQELELVLHYPDYMRRSAEVVPQTQGDIRVPRGGGLTFRGTSTKPLVAANVQFDQDNKVPLVVAESGDSFEGRFDPERTGLLILEVLDTDRLQAGKPTKLFLRVVEDHTPQVEFKTEGIGSMVTASAMLPGELAIQDDYGLSEAKAWMKVIDSATGESRPQGDQQKDPPKPAPFEPVALDGLHGFEPGGTQFVTETLLDLKLFNPDPDPDSVRNKMRPGQFLSLKITARDNFGPGEPQQGESDVLTLRIVSREKLMEDLERRLGEARRGVQQIIEEEKADRSELAEILSPAAEDPKAARARLRIGGLAREQRALGKRTQGVGQRYLRILEEMRNNRIMEPNQAREVEGRIPGPLIELATEDFPSSADLVREFSESGEEDIRHASITSYDSIIGRLSRILAQMREMESLSTLLESLRQVIKVQNSAIDRARKRRDADAAGAFGPDKPPRDGSKEKKR